MGSNPASTNYNRDAVNNVNYYHAIVFCNKLSVMHVLTPCYTISGYSNSYWGSITHTDVAWVDSNGDKWGPWNRDVSTGFRLCRMKTYQ